MHGGACIARWRELSKQQEKRSSPFHLCKLGRKNSQDYGFYVDLSSRELYAVVEQAKLKTR